MEKFNKFFNRSHDKHDIRETSTRSLHDLVDMGEKQRLVYDCILEDGKKGMFPTDREIAAELKMNDPNAVRPRRFELMKMGLIVEAGKRVCSVSGKLALTWKTKGAEPIVEFKGDKAFLLRHLNPEEWVNLRDMMIPRGYTYAGTGVWQKVKP